MIPSPDRRLRHRGRSLALLIAMLIALPITISAAARAADAPSVDSFLQERGIARESRRSLEAATEWGDEQQQAVVRVLARITAPAELARAFAAGAADLGTDAVEVSDRFVKVAGRATFVAPQPLSAEQAQLAGSGEYDVVRIASAAGPVVDVLVARAPKAWPRWQPIDEPAVAYVLPLASGAAPRPGPPPEAGAPWPDAKPALVAATARVAWEPDTPLGRLGMDYGLFDTVRDGGRLAAGDADAFYGLLAAVGRDEASGGRLAAAGPDEILAIIDPARKWFADNRGGPVTISGIARKATRIAIDEPDRRAQVGADHYWELFVFVETPPIVINGDPQDNYPIVCCVRSLPQGMPTGDSIAERVEVAGFALKRYGYPLADVAILSSQGNREEKGRRMETALLLGREAVWKPNPSTAGTMSTLSWIFTSIAAAVAAVLFYGIWSSGRAARADERQARAALPERVELPGQSD